MNNDRLKFRVWDKITKRYFYLELKFGDNGYHPDFIQDPVFEQCTGLRDKNGNLIYEGDIVQFVQKRGYYTDKGDVCTIEFGTFRFCGFGWRSRPENTVDFALTESAAKKCVIVGNIHERKEER